MKLLTCFVLSEQMSDPFTTLMHAVQVMNLLKTLIIRTIKDREVYAQTSTSLSEHQDEDNSGSKAYSSVNQIKCLPIIEGGGFSFQEEKNPNPEIIKDRRDEDGNVTGKPRTILEQVEIKHMGQYRCKSQGS